MSTDARLLASAAGGDADAFARLFDRHVNAVFWQAYAVVGNPDDAEDVAQEVFVTAWRRRAEVRIVDESVLPWLLVTARFTAQNSRRRSQRQRLRVVDESMEVADTAADTERVVETSRVQAAIETAVAALSPVDQQLFRLCVDGDHTYEQAAAELGLSHGGVRNRVSRLRHRLRRDLHDVKEEA